MLNTVWLIMCALRFGAVLKRLVMPGRMFKEEYKNRNLHPLVLSRTLDDSGTITSPIIPWNTCGAYMYSVLAVVYGVIGFNIKQLTTGKVNKLKRALAN